MELKMRSGDRAVEPARITQAWTHPAARAPAVTAVAVVADEELSAFLRRATVAVERIGDRHDVAGSRDRAERLIDDRAVGAARGRHGGLPLGARSRRRREGRRP